MSEFRKIPQLPQNKKAPRRQLEGAKTNNNQHILGGSPTTGKFIPKIKPLLASRRIRAANLNSGTHHVELVIDGQSVSCSADDVGSSHDPPPSPADVDALLIEGADKSEVLIPASVFELKNDDHRMLREYLADEPSLTVKNVSRLLAWSDRPRQRIIALLSRRTANTQYVNANGHATASLIEALCEHCPAPGAAAVNAWKRCVLEAVVAIHGRDFLAALQPVHTALKRNGITTVRISDLRKHAEALVKRASSRNVLVDNVTVLVDSELASAFGFDELEAPSGWSICLAGVTRSQRGEPQEVLRLPVLVTGRQDAVDGMGAFVTVAWLAEGRLVSHVVPRGQISDRRRIVELAEFGLPVTSENAGEVVRFLVAFEQANLARLSLGRLSRRMGWHFVDGHVGFLLGERYITTAKTPKEARVEFHGVDEGDRQLASGFHTAGSWDEWLRAIRLLSNYPRAMLTFWACLTPLLLDILRAPNFWRDSAGPTSLGKSSELRAAASCYGLPDERNPRSIVRNLNATDVGLERYVSTLGDLPLFADDSKLTSSGGGGGRMIYTLVQGRSRARGSIPGLAGQTGSRLVVLSNGEHRITSLTTDGGARMRVLGTWGSPFGRADDATARIVDTINGLVCENYGHAAPRLLEFIVARQNCWETWRAKYGDLVAHYEDVLPRKDARRIAKYLAAIRLTARIAHQALGFDWTLKDPIQPVMDELCAATGDADTGLRSFQFFKMWATANQRGFDNRQLKASAPNGGWFGRWDSYPDSVDEEAADRWTQLGILPHVLERVLREQGYEPSSCIDSWIDRGWLMATTEKDQKRHRRKMKVGGQPMWLIAISRKTWDSVD
jgi:putative DNA primase/helicase